MSLGLGRTRAWAAAGSRKRTEQVWRTPRLHGPLIRLVCREEPGSERADCNLHYSPARSRGRLTVRFPLMPCPPSAGLTSSASFERPIGGAVKNPPLFHLKKDRRDPLDRASASRCPSCGAAEQTVLTRTVAAVYFGCNACGHLWSLPKRGQELSAPLEIEFLQTD